MVAPTLMLLYIMKVQPYEVRLLNKIEAFNEITIISVGYFFLTFSNFLLDSKLKYELGSLAMYFVLLNISLNLLGMIYNLIMVLKRIICKKKLKEIIEVEKDKSKD